MFNGKFNKVYFNVLFLDSMVSKGESPVFELKHLEFFCGKLPVKIYWDEKSGIHFAFVESVGTNIINASVNYGKDNFKNYC